MSTSNNSREYGPEEVYWSLKMLSAARILTQESCPKEPLQRNKNADQKNEFENHATHKIEKP